MSKHVLQGVEILEPESVSLVISMTTNDPEARLFQRPIFGLSIPCHSLDYCHDDDQPRFDVISLELDKTGKSSE